MTDSNYHIGLSSQCVFGNHDSTAYRGCTRPFAFPHSGHIITKVDGLRLCRFADCKTCSLSPEYVPIHYECYEIFRASCSVKGTDALHRLWVVAAWKRPWRKAQPIRLRGTVDVGVLRMVAHRARLPLLAKLPAEVIDMIYGHSPHALLWRCVSATSLAMQVSATEPQPLSMIPLGDVLSWERHGQLKYAGHTWTTMHASLLLRLPIRSDGISKVERLSSLPQPEARNSPTSAFVIVRVKFIDGVVLQLQVRHDDAGYLWMY
ncbi:uncharacterized protein SPSK_05444 [Sporothrix schenckii 1099-18]|uniref:Uncharacterized protein n=1 Tax=Sporothrix schenckii 1099-18 TaxID=1397361 RepID=A0A0F2LWQ9_SPOSC|nr:uncharacterized protein SPSK_05444 [Sporothrix schenckii 1099-18]KJR80336.1 hypothetical protein SPSK_05444 [Sporothrix schenckii 1099-18]